MNYLALRSAQFIDVQKHWKDLLQCVITVAKASMTSNTLPGVLVRFVCFCNAHLTPPSSKGGLVLEKEASAVQREIQDNLRSFATACGMDSEDYTTQHTEHTVLHSFLSTSPQSVHTLSRCFPFPSYTCDNQWRTTSIIMLQASVDKWYPKNCLLNLELAFQLFLLRDMKDKDSKEKREKGKEINKEEEKKICDLLDESYSCAVIAASSAFNRLQLSLPESGAEVQDLSLEGKKERADLLCVEQSAAPRFYQEAAELVYRIDCIRAKSAQGGVGIEGEGEGEGGGGKEEVTLEANARSSDSYRQYLRGIHWMPSLASYAYLK
jgi:hypothetical protein